MNQRPDIDRVLSNWMADGPTAIPDRVVDVVAARIGVQRQRPTWLSARRTNVTTQIKLIAGLAAALVVAVVGYSLLPGPPGTGGPTTAPTPSAQPSAALTPSPPASAEFPSWYTSSDGDGAGILSAGIAATSVFQPGSTFTVPAGWVNDTDTPDFFGLFPDSPVNKAEYGRSGQTAQGIFMGMVDTPSVICDGVGGTHGSTAAELVDSLVANEALVTSEPVSVTIGGLTGTRVDAHIDPDWTGTCPLAPDDPPTKDYKDYRGRFVFLDIAGGRKLLIIADSVQSAGFEAFLAEAMPIIESFEFDLGA